MSRLEVQGIVSARTGEPMVQFRQVADDGTEEFGWQQSVVEAREHAHNVLEATFNAVYDAALISWSKENGDENMGIMLVDQTRRWRADHWGLPDKPEDWR
jgi:hypothetical protein